MWGKKRRARAAAERMAEGERLRAEITADIMARVGTLLSLDPVAAHDHPNTQAIRVALRDLPLAKLTLKFFGYELGRRLASELPVRAAGQARIVDLACKGSTQADMESDWVAHWCAELRIPVLFHRKFWEFAYVLQAMFNHGSLRPGARALGFGCGGEPIPSYLAACGVAVTVTDLAPEEALAAGWSTTGQHAASLDQAFQSHLVDRAKFDTLVDYKVADMNAIPADLAGYDMCWSICALEHIGSIANGLTFIERSLDTLRPGGLSVHTTEFNLNPTGPTIDNWPTVLFQRDHFTALAERLREQGHDVAPFDFDLGDRPMDRFIDMPPWGSDLPHEWSSWYGDGAHLKVSVDGFPATCFGLIVRKRG